MLDVIGIMKQLCAPIRDTWLVQLERKCRSGSQITDEKQILDFIIEILQELFSILRLMKLDMANYHIQTIKPTLLQNSIEYERGFFFFFFFF